MLNRSKPVQFQPLRTALSDSDSDHEGMDEEDKESEEESEEEMEEGVSRRNKNHSTQGSKKRAPLFADSEQEEL